jgi:putative two-component system response regulator
MVAEPDTSLGPALDRVLRALDEVHVTGIARTNEEALELARRTTPDVALVDLSMPVSVIPALTAIRPDIRIIALADASTDGGTKLVDALASGAVGAIYKDGPLDQLARALRWSTRSAPVMAEDAAGLLLGSYIQALAEKRRRDIGVIQALASAVEFKDLSTGHHLRRVERLAVECMNHIDPALAVNEEVAYGFRLHDIGKIGIPDAILRKPAPLTEEEWAVMRRHPELGVSIVAPLGFSRWTMDVISCHHERWDGGGYPRGLTCEEIPITARVFSIADAFDAMTTDRPYRSAMTPERAVEQIWTEAGKAYDPDVVKVFAEMLSSN